MKNKKIRYEKGDLKKTINSLLKERFVGSVKFNEGEILFLDGELTFIKYKNEPGKNLEFNRIFDYKIEELSDEELRLRIKWHELLSEEKDRKSIIKNLGISDVNKEFVVKILEKEDLLYLLKQSDKNAPPEK